MSLQDRIESLKAKHAALDMAIEAENRRPYPNEPQISVLKRQKLAIKDELTRIGPTLRH
jgi:Protein of unknown function (DUF465).